MEEPDFFEFMILHELLFPEEEDREYKCPYCGRVIRGSEKVEWIDKKRGIFKCPDCGKKLNI
jgi:predicted RNA-binding Zn-ribbon protein involved in translation (DUF1610 family)